MRDKKLMIVLGSMSRGGAERVISHISEYFAAKGWNVWIVLLLFHKVDYTLHENVKVVNLTGSTQSRVKRVPYWIRGIRKLVKEIQPDTVLSFAARINIITQFACLGLKQNVVVSERNDPFSDGRSKNVDRMTNWLYPKAKAVVFQTKRSTTYFQKLNLKNACVIPNPVAVECLAEGTVPGKIVTVGRLTLQKNQKMLIDAFAEVKKEFPYAVLHLFGGGELREDLVARAERLGLSDSVFFRGNVSDVHQQMKDAALFVLPSDYEGLSNALLEAMMMGLPCISTDCAGSDEYIKSGENGLLVPVGDTEALTKAMRRMLQNEEEAKLFGQRAAQTVAGLNKETILREWSRVLE